MTQTQTQTKTKTKTAVGVALGVALFGTVGFSAGLYYYGQRINYISSKSNCDCPACPTCPSCDTADKDTPPSTPPSSGNVDLVLSSKGGSFSSFEAGVSINRSVTVQNQGTDPSGPFAVVGNYNGNRVTQQVSNLNGGESQSFSLKGSAGTARSIHNWCLFSITVDANNQVKETNENNNLWAYQSYRGR